MIKKIIITILMIIALLFFINDTYGKEYLFYVYIDPGHGGKDPGTVYEKLEEKDINLNIGLALKKAFEKDNIKVYMTRSGDYDLSSPNALFRKKSDFDNRILSINKSNADLYLSIHINYLEDTKYSGIQAFGTSDNMDMANFFQESLNNERTAKVIDNSLYMYNKINKPGILIECGFISNSKDREIFQTREGINFLANNIYMTTKNYYINKGVK